jgi:HK97 family phage prohead protease
MDATKREIRTIECELAVREAAEGSQGESRTITGTAIVFNSESEVLDDWGQKFREIIKPEAAQMAFLNTQDIKLNMLHDRQLTLARCKEGRGSLRLSVDGKGVNFEFDAPKCDIGDRALELVRTGVYSGCSFEFIPDQYEVEERGADKEVRITHKRFKAITALTIGMDPAYRATQVNAREMWNKTPTAKREAEEAKRKADEEARLQQERERHEKALAQEREKIKMLQEQRRREMELDNFNY